MADAPTLDHADVERIRALLKDPVAVHLNMLHGHIAKIDMRMLAHAHGQEMQDRWAAFERWEAAAPPSPPVAAPAEPVAYLLKRKTGEGEWLSDGRRWMNAPPHPDVLDDVAKYPGEWRIDYAYLGAPQPPRPGTAPLSDDFMLELATAAELRAYDYAVAAHCSAVANILDGKDDGSGTNHEPWGAIRRRLLVLVKPLTPEQAETICTAAQAQFSAGSVSEAADYDLMLIRGAELAHGIGPTTPTPKDSA